MKIFFYKTVPLLCCLILFSCSSYREITIFGQPGTIIAEPSLRTEISKIGNDGKTTFKIYDGKYALLLAKPQNSNYYIPFVLNRKEGVHVNEWGLVPAMLAVPLWPFYPFIFKGDSYLPTATNEDMFINK